MICDALPDTGVAHLGLTMVIAVVLLAAGALALFFARSRRAGGAAVLLVVLIAGSAIAFMPGSSASAAILDCGTQENSLTITQTSTMEGIGPGVAAIPIAGTVENHSTDSTFIFAIAVEIVSVTRAPGAVPGDCDPSDFTLLGARMPVSQALAPGGATTFSGATIGFNDKISNQDACIHATILLRYSTSP